MTPTIVLKDGKVSMVSARHRRRHHHHHRRQTSSSAVADQGLNIQQAVDAPRFHQQYLPDIVKGPSPGFLPATLQSLTAMGYTLEPANPGATANASPSIPKPANYPAARTTATTTAKAVRLLRGHNRNTGRQA